jgi:hypothetical protein
MAAAHAPRLLLLLVLAAAVLAAMPATCAAASRSKKSYRAIFSFGDSLSDAGNLIVNGTPKALTTARPPYGMTFFRKPTGRCSNGRLVVDFLGTVSVMCISAFSLCAATHGFGLFSNISVCFVFFFCDYFYVWALQYLIEMSLLLKVFDLSAGRGPCSDLGGQDELTCSVFYSQHPISLVPYSASVFFYVWWSEN